jgi:hypothetical protein
MPKHSSASRKKSSHNGRPSEPARKAAPQGRTPQQPSSRPDAHAGATPPNPPPASSRSRLEDLRTRRPVAPNQRYRARRAWWQGLLPIIGTVVVVAALVALFISLGRGGPGQTTAGGNQASEQVLKNASQVNPSVFKQVGNGGLPNPWKPITGAQPLTGATGKPQVLYFGADYCPFCAAERWSIVAALSRFGTFHNLQTIRSSEGDISTFSFHGSTYTSQYIDFSGVELAGSDPNTPLQTPTAQQQQVLKTYNAPPYVPADQAGSIPFMDVANQFYAAGAGYHPQVLTGLSAEQIASKLSNPSDPVTRAIVGNANYLTNAICKVTNNQPADVCASAPISGIAAPARAGG